MIVGPRWAGITVVLRSGRKACGEREPPYFGVISAVGVACDDRTEPIPAGAVVAQSLKVGVDEVSDIIDRCALT